MASIFLTLLNRSIAAGWLILVVMLVRVLLNKAPKWIRCALWGLVGLRLVCPFSFESVFSLIPSAETLPTEIISGPNFLLHSGLELIDQPVNEYLSDHYFEGVTVPTNYGVDSMTVFSILWLVGLGALVFYAAVSYFRLAHRVRASILLQKKVWICDSISSPFIFGVFRPRIVLPSCMMEEQRGYVIAHEKAHLKRWDHWWKPLGFLLLAVYWFHPLVWLAYGLLCRDIELACDERVIKVLGVGEKKAYSEVLLSCTIDRRPISACPLAFGETGVKERVKNILHYKKPAFWLLIVAVAGCMTVAVCFGTDPAGIKITQIDDGGDLSHMLEEVASIRVISGDRSYEITSTAAVQNVTQLIEDIRVNRTQSSNSRSEARDRTNVIVLYYASQNNELVLCFNPECSELWLDDGVKPSYSYRVKNPELVQPFFESTVQVDIQGEYQVYSYADSVDPMKPTVLLSQKDDFFRFTYSGLSSYIAYGRYEWADSTLTLKTDDRQYVFVFHVKDEKLIFDASQSSEIPKYRYRQGEEPQSPVPDKAIFSLRPSEAEGAEKAAGL